MRDDLLQNHFIVFKLVQIHAKRQHRSPWMPLTAQWTQKASDIWSKQHIIDKSTNTLISAVQYSRVFTWSHSLRFRMNDAVHRLTTGQFCIPSPSSLGQG